MTIIELSKVLKMLHEEKAHIMAITSNGNMPSPEEIGMIRMLNKLIGIIEEMRKDYD